MNPRLALLLIFVCGSIALVAQDQPKFVGKEACWSCHAPEQKTVAGTPHAAGKSCEACHGAGEEHVHSPQDPKNIFSFHRASASEVREKCGQCHSNPTMARHATGDVSCLACHSSHHYVHRKYLLKPSDSVLDRTAQTNSQVGIDLP